MAHRTRLRTPGTWTGTVEQSEFQTFDDGQFSGIDGDAGGTWAPSSPIIVGGFGLHIGSGAALEITSGGVAQVDSGGSMVLAGGSTALFAGTLAAANLTMSGPVILSGNSAKIAYRSAVKTDGGSVTIDAAHDTYYAPLQSTNRTWTVLSTSGTVPAVGNKIRVVKLSTENYSLLFVRENSQQIATFPASSSVRFWVVMEYFDRGDGNGLQWQPIEWADGVTLF